MTAITAALLSVALATETVEVPVAKVFIPATGFDDNDRVEAVVDGILPDSCHRLGETRVSRLSAGEFSIVQEASRSREGACRDSGTLPPHLKLPVPFTVRAKLGRLPKGAYRVNGTAFRVDPAPVVTIDTVPYASVNGVHAAAVYYGTLETPVVITGTVPSDCFRLPETLDVYRTGDVLVVLPKMEIIPGVECAPAPRAFERRLDFGELPLGRYLVHVRSAGGDSAIRAFSREAFRPDGPDDGDELSFGTGFPALPVERPL